MTTNMDNNSYKSTGSTKDNPANGSVTNAEVSLKRKADTINTDTITSPSSSNNDIAVPTKKLKIISDKKLPSCSKIQILPKSEHKNILSGIRNFYITTNRMDIYETRISNDVKPSLNDKQPFLKEEFKNRDNSFNSDDLKNNKSERDLSKEFKFLLHTIDLKKEKNEKLTGCLKITGPLNILSEIYCFTKLVNGVKHFALNEIKYYREKSLLSYKELSSPQFNLKKYFKIFIHLSKELSHDEKINEFKIYCNRDLDKGSMQKNKMRVVESDLEEKLYRFKICKDHKMYTKFLKFCELKNLAILIIECINERKPATIKYKLFKKYHMALMKENVLAIEDGNESLIAKFHDDFIKNDASLSNAAKELRNQVTANLNIPLTNEISFKIYKNFDADKEDPIDLPNEQFDKLFDTFFKVFRLEVINKDIDSIVKKSLSANFAQITDEAHLKALKEDVFSFLERPTNLKGTLFQSLSNKLSKCIIKKKLLDDIEPKVKVELEQNVLNKFRSCLDNLESHRMILLRTDHKLLSTLLVKHFIRQITNDVEESLFISAKTFLQSTDDVIRSLACNSTQFLTVQWDENCDKNQAQAALKKFDHDMIDEKYVLIVSNINISEQLDYEFNQIIDENQSFNLTPESHTDVLNFENVYLHGQLVRMTDLADDEAAIELIKNQKILEDILYRKIIIGKDLVKPDGFEEKFFDVRHLQYEDKTINNVLNDESKIIFISGRPGIGKSVYLYDLANRLRGSSNSLWIMQLNLNEKLLEQYSSDQNCNYETFVKGVVDLDDACQVLFDMAMNGSLKIRIVLFIDGYDELKQEKSISFIQILLKQLQSSHIHKIYIASNSKTLETSLGVSSYSLIFSDAEKEEFLQKYPDIDRTNILKNDTYRDYINTPLHLKMLVDLLKGNVDLKSLKNIHDLYQEYVKFKLPSDKEFESVCQTSKMKLLEEQGFTNFDLKIPKELLHTTFTEYFAGKWLSRETKRGQEAKYNVFKCVDRLIKYTSSIFIETYLAPFALDSLVDELIQTGYFNFLKKVLNLNKTKKPCLRNVIESTHTNSYEILKYILEYYNDIDDTEIMQHGELKKAEYKNSKIVKYVNQLLGNEAPLKMAVQVNRFDLACELMINGADISNLNKESIKKLADYVIDEMIKDNNRHRPILEKLLMMSSDAIQKLKNDNQYHKFLIYFFVHGRTQLIEILLKDDLNRCTLLKTKINGKLILDYVNESRQLNDNDRCVTVKYILDNIGNELRSRDEFYIGSVLAAACKYQQVRTFEYFIDQYPNGYIGYLDQAMRMNECQTIEFLMIKKREQTIDNNGNTALHRAIILDVSPKIIGFLIKNVSIDHKNKAGKTALCLAFEKSADFRLIKYLIRNEASLSVEDNTGLYPWCYSILTTSPYSKEQQIKLMRYLLQKSIMAPERSGISLESDRLRKEIIQKFEYFQNMDNWNNEMLTKKLQEALKESCTNNWCSFLIIHGANLNMKDVNGKTPLHIALEYKRYHIAMMMLQFGAMFDSEDKNHMTPIRLLLRETENIQEGYTKILELLKLAETLFSSTNQWDEFPPEFWNNVEASPLRYLINCRNSEGLTLFHIAALVRTERLAIKLNEFSKRCCQKYRYISSLDVNASDVDGETPLHVAVTRKRDDVICQLFKIDASYDTSNSIFHSLISKTKYLFESVKISNIEEIEKISTTSEYLINARDKFGRCVLHLVNSVQAMQLLIRPELVNAIDNKRRTPLHLTVKNNQLKCAILLLKYGASYDLEDWRGFTPFGRKRLNNETAKMLKMIDTLYKDIKSDDPQILSSNNPDTLTNYLSTAERDYGITPDITVNIKDSKKKTLLHYARRFNYVPIAVNLIEHGALADLENPEVD